MKSILAPALALAVMATPFAAATAAPQNPNEVRFNDLDLESAAGRKTLDARIRNVARNVCKDEQKTGTRVAPATCMENVRRQVLAQVERYQNRVGKGG